MLPIPLRYVDTAPQVPTGITWGVPVPRGEIDRNAALHLRRADGGAIATQHWPLAFWPDGSVKWLGLAAVLGPADGLDFTVVSGAGPAPAQPLRVWQPGIEVFRRVASGGFVCDVGDRGRYVIQELVRDGRTSAGGSELVCLIEQRHNDGPVETRSRERFVGIIADCTIEQDGPVRAVIRLSGKYRGERSRREILPFTVRLVFYAGCEQIGLVHSFVFDGDPERDFIAGLGLSIHTPLNEGVHNRQVRFVGEAGAGVWGEPIRLLPNADAHAQTTTQALQLRGEGVPAAGNGGMLPAWADMQLFQDSADHAVLRKRQGPDSCWVTIDHCRRAPGIIAIHEPAGGLAVAVRDFWQAHPTAVEVTGGGGTETKVQAWWWSPEAAPMDLRHYGRRDHRPVYEAVNPDPAIYSSAFGVARTSQLTLWAQAAGTTAGELLARRDLAERPPLLTATVEHLHRSRVFAAWTPADRATPIAAAFANGLAGYMEFYLAERERRRWYGFWDYGDFMHTFNPLRHCWQYDHGGSAWHNTELGADQWPWYAFLTTGRGDWFRFAEAMTRHVAEVDVFHLGPWTGQGSRHNVVHWGCPCKEPRVSQASAKRFLHFFTADERCRDLLDEVAHLADQFQATNVPTDGSHVARPGPTWSAWVANWLCAWERSGDGKWLKKILVGIDGILAAPHQLINGGAQFGYDPDLGTMKYLGEPLDVGNRLVAIMGGMETWMEFLDLHPHPGFAAAVDGYARAFAATKDECATLDPMIQNRLSLRWPIAALAAWTAQRHGDRSLARRAWTMLLEGDGFKLYGDRLDLEVQALPAPKLLSAEPRVDYTSSTNQAGLWSLCAFHALALIGPPDQLPAASWPGMKYPGHPA